MAITLTQSELLTLQTLSDQATPGSYWTIYQWLVNTLSSKGVAESDQTMMWLRGATQANAGRGAMSELIRTYTKTQYQLRYGEKTGSGLKFKPHS